MNGMGFLRLSTFFVPISAAVLLFVAGAKSSAGQDRGKTAIAGQGSTQKMTADENYILGPGDQIQLQGVEVEDLSKAPLTIDSSGSIRLPMAGTIHCAGMTVDQLQEELRKRLLRYYKDPQVTVTTTELRNYPVSVIGAVKKPGVTQLQGSKTLVEVLADAGGLDSDSGDSIKVSRQLRWGRLPLPDAVDDGEGKFSLASIGVKALLSEKDPAMNITIRPNDVVTVPRAGTVYVVGEVKNAGGFVLKERNTITVLQALSLAQGLSRTAKAGNARILRYGPSGNEATKQEIPIDLPKMLAGKMQDTSMQPNDVLFVPNSTAKTVTFRSVEAGIQLGTGLLIWRQ